MIDRLTATEIFYGMVMSLETTNVMKITRKPSPVQIMIENCRM
jgi:hypothetical protein